MNVPSKKKYSQSHFICKVQNVVFCDLTPMFMSELLHGGIVSPISKQQCFH